MKLGKYKFEFKYWKPEDFENLKTVTTICVFGEDHYMTSCSPKDNFCKETGRKISLTRAIAHLPKEERTQIWKDYFNRKNKQ